MFQTPDHCYFATVRTICSSYLSIAWHGKVLPNNRTENITFVFGPPSFSLGSVLFHRDQVSIFLSVFPSLLECVHFPTAAWNCWYAVTRRPALFTLCRSASCDGLKAASAFQRALGNVWQDQSGVYRHWSNLRKQSTGSPSASPGCVCVAGWKGSYMLWVSAEFLNSLRCAGGKNKVYVSMCMHICGYSSGLTWQANKRCVCVRESFCMKPSLAASHLWFNPIQPRWVKSIYKTWLIMTW